MTGGPLLLEMLNIQGAVVTVDALKKVALCGVATHN